jgi:hypothetical protein
MYLAPTSWRRSSAGLCRAGYLQLRTVPTYMRTDIDGRIYFKAACVDRDENALKSTSRSKKRPFAPLGRGVVQTAPAEHVPVPVGLDGVWGRWFALPMVLSRKVVSAPSAARTSTRTSGSGRVWTGPGRGETRGA